MISIIASIFRFTLRTFLLLSFLFFGLLPTLLVISHYQNLGTPEGWRKGDAGATRLANWLLWLFGIRLRATGAPLEGSALIAANHISWLDILALHANGAMGFVGKAEIQQWPVFSFVARAGGTIFHQRGCHDSAADVTSMMAQRLKNGRRVAIFPEGGILPGADIRVFHARMFKAAVDAGCPVQPVMVRYIRDGRRDDEILFRDGESMLSNIARVLSRPSALAEVHFLPPISSIDQPRRTLAEAARAAVINSYES